MPYITQHERLALAELKYVEVETPGQLNYAITTLAHQYLADHGESYETLNAVVGAFECAKAEFIRRKVTPYEDVKIATNGDL